jgi:hypothetical protein
MAIPRNELLKSMRSDLDKIFKDTYNEEAFKLYNYVVHIEGQKVTVTTIGEGSLTVTTIGEGSSRNIQHMEETPYANIEEVPVALRNSVKRLMWCTDGDIHAGLGMKVNDSTYWVN